MLPHQEEEVGKRNASELGCLAMSQSATTNLFQEPEDPHLLGDLARVPGSVLESILGDLDLNRSCRCRCSAHKLSILPTPGRDSEGQPGHLSARPPDTCQPDGRPDACPQS